MKQKLTPWFPGHIKPVRKGVFMQENEYLDVVGYQYWNHNRKQWGEWCETPEAAYRLRNQPVCDAHQNDRWRGLANKQKGGIDE